MSRREDRWVPVPGWEGLYEVSSGGQVRSLPRTDSRGRRWPGCVLRPTATGKGYRVVEFRDSPRSERWSIHRLVCEAFHGPAPEGKPLALHWDDNKENNTESNLYWGDDSENQRDAVRNGRHAESGKQFCDQGHEFSPENTRVTAEGYRRCRACNRARPHWPDLRAGMRASCPVCGSDQSHKNLPRHIIRMHGVDREEAIAMAKNARAALLAAQEVRDVS